MSVEYELLDAKNQLNITLNRNLIYDFIVEDKVEININLSYSDLNRETLNNNNNILLGQYVLDISKKDKKINLYLFFLTLIFQLSMDTVKLRVTQI